MNVAVKAYFAVFVSYKECYSTSQWIKVHVKECQMKNVFLANTDTF